MYSTKTATINASEFNSSYMPVGINDNITLKEVNVNTTPNGRTFLEIIFEDSEGRTASMTEWKNEKNMWIKTDEDLQKRDDQQFGRILQIIDCFYETRPDFEGNNFVEMINWVKTTLDNRQKDNKLRLKVIYDKKGYTTVSPYGIYVEPMTVETSQISLFKRDLLERPIVADNEPAIDPLVDNANESKVFNTPEESGTTGASDLPF